ncbi:hypothetical protein CDD83_5239 [Cordyceps sp. RAO-2017]|nr:hypothetical protein CDD83_5239 [Cordyceps sp. RAO-2017]
MRDLAAAAAVPPPVSPPPSGAPLKCFQLTSPVLMPQGLVVGNDTVGVPHALYPICRRVLMNNHVFANSYEHPFVTDYAPPTDCEFGRVVLNLTIVSQGRQYDRLASLWLGDVEVWRTSTAEPKAAPGIVWTHLKDVTHLMALWQQPQPLIFDLGNLVNERYTGSFNATLSAVFFGPTELKSPLVPHMLAGQRFNPAMSLADRIVGLTARRGRQGRGSAFVVPGDRAETLVELPRRIRRAVVAVAATGQADEEFWWSNVPDAGRDVFNNVTLPAGGSLREVRLRIDGQLVGLSWPFPVVFTGGIAPPLHRPVVGIDAFDMGEQEIDVTPWLARLADGVPHNFSLEVVDQDERPAGRHWVLAAKLFLWLAPGIDVIESTPPVAVLRRPDYRDNVVSDPDNLLQYAQRATRHFTVTAILSFNKYVKRELVWTQKLMMENDGTVMLKGNFQYVRALYRGQDTMTENLEPLYYRRYEYPLSSQYMTSVDEVPGGDSDGDGDGDGDKPRKTTALTLRANLNQSLVLVVTGASALPNGIEPFLPRLDYLASGSEIRTQRTGRALFYQKDGGRTSGGFGSTEASYTLSARALAEAAVPDPRREPLLYGHDVVAVNDTVTKDSQYVYQPGLELFPTLARAAEVDVLAGRDGQFAPSLSLGARGGSRAFSARFLDLWSADTAKRAAGEAQKWTNDSTAARQQPRPQPPQRPLS